MKTRSRSLLALLGAACATLLIIGPSAQAGYIVTLMQVGPNVVATGSGAIDLTGLSFFFSATEPSAIVPRDALILTGPTGPTSEVGYLGASGPANFGSAYLTDANSGSGDLVGIDGVGAEGTSLLFVPHGYVSGAALSDRATYDSATFSSLGATPGIYEWTWGTGANQNFTLKIGAAAVPDQGSSLMLLGIAFPFLLGLRLVQTRLT